MKYFGGLFTWILIASGWMIVAQQSKATNLDKEPINVLIDHDVDVENWRLLDIFLFVLRDTGLHGGFVEMSHCSDLPKGRLRIKQGVTIRQAMGAFVAANPGYTWELKDGVINLMPQDNPALLQVRIARFQKDAMDREIEAVLQTVLRLPEVQRREAALGLKQSITGGVLSSGVEHPAPKQPMHLQFNLENLSLQDAFNRIVQGSKKAVWIYHETNCNGSKSFVVEVAPD